MLIPPVGQAIPTGLLKGVSGLLVAATAGTDYLTPTGNGSGLTSLTAANIAAGTAGISISGNAATATTAGTISGSIAQSQVSGLTAALALKAPLASPNFTGNVGIGTTTPFYPLDVTGTIRSGVTSGGLSKGAELLWDVGTARSYVISFDRGLGVQLPLSLIGSTINLDPAGGSTIVGNGLVSAGSAGAMFEVKTRDASKPIFAGYDSNGGLVATISPSGAPAFTGSLTFQANSSTTANQPQAKITPAWADSTHATRKGRVTILASDFSGTDREAIRVESSGSAAMLSFFAGTAVVKPTVTGSRGGNVALASALTALNSLGLLTDSSTA